MKYTSTLSALLVGASVAITASAFAPAQAITLTQLSGTAGNPSGQTLWQAGITQTDIGQSFNVDWSLPANGSSPPAPLSATSLWTIQSFSTTQLVLDIKLSNTTSLINGLTNAGITSFGVGVNPNATVSLTQILASGDSNVFTGVSPGNGPNQTYPGEFNQIDVCIFTQGCNGGSQGSALAAGQTDTLKLTLSGNFGSNDDNLAAALQFFPIKFQTGGGTGDSYELAGVPGTPGTPVPEPITMLGLGIGTVGLGVLKRKYGNKEAKVKVNV